jgi:RNA polymerase sigma-70 factor (ECF subfamily)
MSQTIKEKRLIQQLSQGDQKAFGELFSSYYDKLYYFVFHYLNNEEAAKDVVQDVFSEVWIKHEALEGVQNLSSWMFTLAKNISLKKIDHLKVARKHADYLKYRQLDIVQGSLNELNISPGVFEEINEIIGKTLKTLPAQTRKIFEMSRFENKQNKEIAQELNVSLKSVEAHITKSLKVFRKALQNYLPFILFLLMR